MTMPQPTERRAELKRTVQDYINRSWFRFDEFGNFDPVEGRTDRLPPQLARYRSDPSGQSSAADDRTQEAERGKDLSRTLSKAGACAIEALPEFAAAASLLGLGAPILRKRFVMPRSSPRTSVASKYLAPRIPGEFPRRVWTPTLGSKKALTKSVGRAVARWIPGLGWAMLAHDAYRFGACMLRDDQEGAPNA